MPSEHSPVLVGADRSAVSDHAAPPPGAPATEGHSCRTGRDHTRAGCSPLRSVTDRDPQSHDDQYPDRVHAVGTVLHGATPGETALAGSTRHNLPGAPWRPIRHLQENDCSIAVNPLVNNATKAIPQCVRLVHLPWRCFYLTGATLCRPPCIGA